jgi:alpha-glucosidase
VIYQIYPRSFADSNGDGVGDLAGITQKLDYIAWLGVDAIWISPFFPSPMKDFGYDIRAHCEVDPLFGTLEAFRALLQRAHALGLRVMIDQVLSHTSDQHPWFADSRASREGERAEWYVWADPQPDGTPPNNWLSVFGGSAWQWDTGRSQYYLHNFLACQPDLNFHCGEVREAILEMVRFWLELGVDGYRLDTANFFFHDAQLRNNPPRDRQPGPQRDMSVGDFNPYAYQMHLFDKSRPENLQFLRELRALCDRYPHTVLLGEIGDDDGLARMAEYTAGADRLHMAYSFDLLGPEHSAAFLHQTFERFGQIVRDGWPAWAIGNHDVVRVATRWAAAKASEEVSGEAPDAVSGAVSGTMQHRKLRLAAALQMCLRGTSCIYQGEELGLEEAELSQEELQDPYGIAMWPRFKGRDGCRTPMPWDGASNDAGFGSGAHPTWLPIPAQHRANAVADQQANPQSLLHYYRALIAWRRASPVMLEGSMHMIERRVCADAESPGLLSFVRTLGDLQVLCVFNWSAADLGVDLREMASVMHLPGQISGVGQERPDPGSLRIFASPMQGLSLAHGQLLLQAWGCGCLVR